MDTSSSIRYRLDVEIPRGKFVEITSIGESTWKLWHQWVLDMDFSMSFQRQIDVTSVLAVSVLSFSNIFPNGHTTSNPRQFDVDIKSIRRKPNFDEFPRHFCVLFRCDFEVEKSTWFPRAFFDVIFMVEKSALFPGSFSDVTSMVEKSTLFPRTFISVISMVEICTLFLRAFFDVILMGKDLTSFLVSYKLMKTFEKVFPVFVTLNSWLLQDCSL